MMRMPKIVVTISGPQGSGKTQLETLLRDALVNAGADVLDDFCLETGEILHFHHFGSDIRITTKQD